MNNNRNSQNRNNNEYNNNSSRNNNEYSNNPSRNNVRRSNHNINVRRKNSANFKMASSAIFLMIVIVAILFIFYDNVQKANISPDKSTIKNTLSSANSAKSSQPPQTADNIDNSIYVVIDPGHGGFDVGKEGSAGYKNEYLLTLEVAKKVGAELLNYGITPVYTRTDDNALASDKDSDMQKRVDITNESDAKLFISIHMNSFEEDSSVKGPEVYYYNDISQKGTESSAFANKMQSELNSVSGGTRSSRHGDFMVIRESVIPSILIECGFLSNTQEEISLNSNEYQNKLAKAIAKCIYDKVKE